MPIETPAELNAWVFQQRDAFTRFFAHMPQGSAPHLSQLLRPKDRLRFLGEHAPRRVAYLWRNHYRESWVAELRFRVAGKDRTLLVPAPRKDGVFEVNGIRYTAPVQRLWDTEKGRAVEYRRLDHVLLDGRTRRLGDDDDDGEDEAAASAGGKADKEYGMLASYLEWILDPVRNPERLFSPLEADHNKWGILGQQAQVKTLVADWDAPREAGKTPYRRLHESENLGKEARRPEEGLDPFHTPDGKKIGLTRHLTLGTTIGDGRQLQLGEPGACGLMAALVPFAQHDDGRRVLMACGMMGRAVKVDGASVPKVRTSVERRLRDCMPELAEENVGVDLRVGFMFWEGLNFEDAVVVSKFAEDKLRFVEERVISVPVPCFCTATPIDRGQVKEGDRLATFSFSPVQLGLMMPAQAPAAGRGVGGLFPLNFEWKGADVRCPCDGEITNVTTTELWAEDCPGAARYSRRIDFTLSIDRPLKVGDKLCNRHGNKGVVSQIVPDKEMPHVGESRLDILFNPIGIINRGNYGQLLEALAEDFPDFSLDIGPAPEARMSAVLAKAGDSKRLHREVTVPGNSTVVHAIVGTNHILRMPHYAAEAFNVCGDVGVFSSITEQPAKGVGQKYGEMEIMALQAHGAEAILKELCIKRSREPDRKGRIRPGPQRPLVEWLRAVGLDLKSDESTATIRPRDPGHVGARDKDLFDPSVKCKVDLACNAKETDGDGVERMRLATLYRRLCSEPFFDEVFDKDGRVYLDLGKTLCFDVQKRGVKRWGLHFESRYLPVLHPRYRRLPLPGGKSKTTRCLMGLVRALWKRAKDGDSVSDEEVQERCRLLLRRLIDEMNGKQGIIRRVGLCRRLTRSARMVIVPDPELPVDCVSLPWDAVRVLYEDILRGTDGVPTILGTGHAQARQLFLKEYGEKIDERLRSEWVLVNRAPSLHKYNVMAFHPRVHFDTQAMRIPPLAAAPFAADHDGDEMSVVPLFDEAAKLEAARLSVPLNLISDADGSVIPKFTKDFQLGLYLCNHCDQARAGLNDELAALGFPPLPPEDDVEACVAKWMSKWPWPDPGKGFPDALQLVVDHARRSLRSHQNQSCLGDPAAMTVFLAAFRTSGAAKNDKLWGAGEDKALLDGLAPTTMREVAIKRIDSMIHGKLAIGDFGGYLRRLYYRIIADGAGGLAFRDGKRNVLVSIQSLTERAMQRTLSTKSGIDPFQFRKFMEAVEGIIPHPKVSPRKPSKNPPPDLQNLLDFDPTWFARHKQTLAAQVLTKGDARDLLSFLRDQFKVPLESGLAGSSTDLRIGIFLA